MEFIVRPRRSGKTTDILMWMNGHKDRVMVVHSVQEKRRLLEWIDDRKLEISEAQLITLDQVSRGSLRGRNVRVGVDNLDFMLNALFGAEVDIVAATGDLADHS